MSGVAYTGKKYLNNLVQVVRTIYTYEKMRRKRTLDDPDFKNWNRKRSTIPNL